MASFSDWLRQYGLEQYISVCAENDVGFSVVRKLTEADLRELGLTLGHRKRFLEAVEALDTAPAPAPRTSEITAGAERRQLTIMFCDLVGSTALSRQLDPEALRELMKQYQQACRDVIERYEGHVAQYLGDGLMVYFGFPQAHEDDAERAVRSALEIVGAVKKVPAPSPLCVRVGIATGAVVVGESGGGDASVPKLAVGETPNLAARLQGLADADEIIVGSSTHRLLGSAFEFADLGKQTLKGIPEAVNAYRVASAKAVEGRFEAMRSSTLTPFVGREEEVALLERRWEQAREGEGQVVLLSGEPGIGKSRIFHELRSHIGADAHLRLRYQCSPYHRNSAFHPIIEHLERSAEFTRADPPPDKLNKLEQFLKRSGYFSELSAALLAALLSVPSDGRYAPLTFSPQRQKDETIKVLLALIQALSASHPLLILFEDLHWIDPSSLEALDLLIQQLSPQKILLLLTYRPEFEPRWSGQSHVTMFNLNRLGKKQITAMVSKISGNKGLPLPIVDHILAKTDGVPLFVEELARTILESDLVRETATHYELTRPLTSFSIPSTLQDSLMARLDRLPTAKEIAQTGACIGREFSHDLLAAASSFGESQLLHAVGELIKSGLISRTGSAPHSTYIFKHALVQDVAYQSMLKTNRTKVHTALAQAILDKQPGVQETTPEVIAHHYTQAGLTEKALPFWLSAGQKALARTALPESVGHLSKALELVRTLPPSPERDRSELDIRIKLAIAQMAYGGWAYSEIPKTLMRARDLAERLGDMRNEMLSLFYIWLYHLCVPNIAEAMAYANRLHSLGETTSDRAVILVKDTAMSLTACASGDWERAKLHGDKVLGLYDFDRDSSLTFLLNHDVRCFLLSWGTSYYWALGFPQKAREASLALIESAAQIRHTFNLVWALTGGTEGLIHTGDTKRALECNREVRLLVRENAMTFAENGPCNYFGGPALIANGQFAEGYEMATRAIAFWNSTGGAIQDPMVNNLRAYALGMLGRIDEGIALAQENLRFTHKTNHRTWEPVTYRVLGDLLVKAHQEDDGKLDEAEAAYEEALKISRAKSAKGFELIAATGLAQLWKIQGKAKEAHDLLAPVYNWFTEGFDTKDLKEAKALLDQLS